MAEDRPLWLLLLTILFLRLFQATAENGYGEEDSYEAPRRTRRAPPAPVPKPGDPHNFIRNPGIEKMASASETPIWWQPFIQDYSMTSEFYVHTGDYALKFSTNGGESWQGCGQLVYINQQRPADLILTAWGMLRGVEKSNGMVGIYADVRYQDGTALLDQTIVFGTEGSTDWVQRGIVLVAPKPIHVVMVYIVLDGIYGSAYFDDFSMVESKEMPLSLMLGSSQTMGSGAGGVHYCVEASTCDTDNGPFHVVNHFLAATNHPDRSDITLVTQLSADRLERVLQIVSVWKGPVSAAVYAGKDNFEATRLVLSLWKVSALVRKHVDFHLVTRDAYMDETPYPINMLRNVAWEHARTEQLFLLDVDFIPNPGMREYVQKLFPKLRAIKGLEKAAYVVPAFGASSVKKWPRNRKDLRRLINLNIVKPVHAAKLEAAHGATNYARWYKTKNPFQIIYELFFEPYVVVSKDMPRYDQRFSGYGHDKSSHIFALYEKEYKFIVLPEAFVIHIEHGVPHWRNTANKTRIWVNWYAFALQQEEENRDGAARKFFSGPWEDQLDRKMEMPPSNRPLQALFEEGEMELARQLAVEFIEAKSEKAKTALWDLKCAKQPEPIRSLVRTLVLRFHENLDPLKHALGGDGVNLAKKMTDGHHEGEVVVSD